jgi:hypothetical protein
MENDKRKEERGKFIELYSNRYFLIIEMKICY